MNRSERIKYAELVMARCLAMGTFGFIYFKGIITDIFFLWFIGFIGAGYVWMIGRNHNGR